MNAPLSFDAIEALAFAAIIVAGAIVLARGTGGNRLWTLGLFSGLAVWILSNLLEYVSASGDAKLFWNAFQYCGISFGPVCWLAVCIRFSRVEKRAWQNIIRAGLAMAAAWSVLALLSPRYGFLWTTYPPIDGSPLVQKGFRPLFWVFLASELAFSAAGFAVLVHGRRHASYIHRNQTRVIAAAYVLPVSVAILDAIATSGMVRERRDLAPAMLGVSALLVLYAIWRLKLLDRLPVAHKAIVDDLSDAVYVLDTGRRVLFANREAVGISGRTGAAGGAPEEMLRVLDTLGEGERDLDLDGKHLRLVVSPLRDWRGTRTGDLVYLRDVTEQRRLAEDLERLVCERTAELTLANEGLEREIARAVDSGNGLRKALAEKDFLLREVHHRVKNNLQLVMSLLRLQTNDSGGVAPDGKVENAFAATLGRVRSISLVHEKLYKDDVAGKVDVATYLRELVLHASSAYAVDVDAMDIGIAAGGLRLDLDPAVNLGLLVNELVANAFKHGGSEGKIIFRAALDPARGALRIVVRDDGPGYPEGFATAMTGSLGLRIVRTLVDQLRGTVDFGNDEGAVASVIIPLDAL